MSWYISIRSLISLLTKTWAGRVSPRVLSIQGYIAIISPSIAGNRFSANSTSLVLYSGAGFIATHAFEFRYADYRDSEYSLKSAHTSTLNK